ncbi:MAG: type II restriction endonuclease [Paludibacteraceae bacterium]|nr:type II restriction endonuclease [Paludibacteraceae bacterium]
MGIQNKCISCADDLFTEPEQTKAGFVEAALKKNEKASDYIKEAETLKLKASNAKEPMDLLKITDTDFRNGLLTASGLSDKSLDYFDDSDEENAISEMINKFLKPAGDAWLDVLIYRYLLIRGDSLGGSMRNFVGSLAEMKLKRKLLDTLNNSNKIPFSILKKANKAANNWNEVNNEDDFKDAFDHANEICAISWNYTSEESEKNRVLFFNANIPLVEKENNVDICLYRGTPKDYNSGKIVKKHDRAIMFGELKGGIDPAGADEHWKTAQSALEKIRKAFAYKIKTSFVGAAIEVNMAGEIFKQLEEGVLTNAANLTSDGQLAEYCEWLVSL